MCDFFFNVVEEKNYMLGPQVQNGLESSAMAHQIFGRSESGNQFLHKWVDYYLDDTGPTSPPVMNN